MTPNNYCQLEIKCIYPEEQDCTNYAGEDLSQIHDLHVVYRTDETVIFDTRDLV